jgi:DNA-binding beta-propeller fold protein YncE
MRSIVVRRFVPARLSRVYRLVCALMLAVTAHVPAASAGALLPDGRTVAPEGFTIPVEGFATDAAASPDGAWLAVLAEGAGAVDIISTSDSILATRLPLAGATGLTWTGDGLYVTRGYAGTVSRFRYDGSAKGAAPGLTPRGDLPVPGGGLLNGVAEDPVTHRLAVARTADREVVTLDDTTGKVLGRRPTDGQPFAVAISGDATFATLYDSDHVAAWRGDAPAVDVPTGPHPTALSATAGRVFVADADGHDVVELDPATFAVAHRYDLSLAPGQPPGQTPSGMALSGDGKRLFVAESGFNDVAVVALDSGRILTRIPTGWYPMSVFYQARATGKKDARVKEQLWIVSAQGLGAQPDPAGEWNGTYTGLVSHLILEPGRFAEWNDRVARNDGFARPAAPIAARRLPPIRHVVFIVRENKQFDEEFGDEPRAAADPALLVYGRAFTPNAHALAERYTLFDEFMGNGEASIYGHAWTTQGMTNDYHERNAHARDEDGPAPDARVAWSIWPYPVAGEDSIPQAAMDFDWFKDLAALENGPRVDVSGVFGPRGELIDELQRKHVAFRVYGEQMTMRSGGKIAPGLAEHADRDYPGAHIDFDVLDTERAKLFLSDVAAHGLPQYAYLTLPTDHTAGTKAGFYTPASYVASNDVALGQIVAGLSHRADWRDTVVFVTTDDPQGTGDHVDSHRMPAFAIGPYVRRGFVDHTRYSIPSILRTVEVLYGLAPLNIYDAAATPMLDAFTSVPRVDGYTPLPANVPLERNPGKAASLELPIDGPGAAAIAAQEWHAMRGAR